MARKRKTKKKSSLGGSIYSIERSIRSVRNFLKLIVKIAALVGVLIVGAGGGYFLQGRVVKISDGDTIRVLSSSGVEKIRLYGIDCPESNQPGGNEATAFTRQLVYLDEVDVTVVNKDQYGRTVALVTLKDGRVLNEELVKAGHAWVYKSFCKRTECLRWIKQEADARRNKEGLWRKQSPTPPWSWRSAKTSRSTKASR